MICKEVDKKVDEKVFHFLYAHIFSYPRVLEKFIKDSFPEILPDILKKEYDVRLNKGNVDLEISFNGDVGIYFEFKTNIYKTDEAVKQLDHYKKWPRHNSVKGVIVIPREIAKVFIDRKKMIPQDIKVVSMEKLNEYALELVPAYLFDCVLLALEYLPQWRVDPDG